MSENVARWFDRTDLSWAELDAERGVLSGMVLPRLRRMVEPRGYTVIDYTDGLEDALFGNGVPPDRYDLDRLPTLGPGRTGTADVTPLVYVREKNRYDREIDAALRASGMADPELHDGSMERHMAGLERGRYAAAIDPVGKHVDAADPAVREEMDWLGTCWENATTITYPVSVRGIDVDAAGVTYVE